MHHLSRTSHRGGGGSAHPSALTQGKLAANGAGSMPNCTCRNNSAADSLVTSPLSHPPRGTQQTFRLHTKHVWSDPLLAAAPPPTCESRRSLHQRPAGEVSGAASSANLGFSTESREDTRGGGFIMQTRVCSFVGSVACSWLVDILTASAACDAGYPSQP